MRKMIVLCDRCNKEIGGNPIRINPAIADRKSGDILDDWRKEEFMSRDYCTECAERIMAVAIGMVEKEDFRSLSKSAQESQPVIRAGAVVEESEQITDEVLQTSADETEPEKPVKTKRALDIGKIMALKDAGWSNEKIAEEMGATPGTIAVYVCKERKKHEKERKEKQNH